MYMYVCVTLIILNNPEHSSLKPITHKNPTVNSRTHKTKFVKKMFVVVLQRTTENLWYKNSTMNLPMSR